MASGFTASSMNYPLLAIPAYYIFSLTPHIYAFATLKSAGFQPNNANPKASTAPDKVKGKVPEEVWGRYQRAENAHSNCMEQIPLFASAVLSSLLAERVATPSIQIGGTSTLDPTGLTTYIATWFAIRAAYTVAYVSISDHKTSLIRSALWAVGTGLSVWQIVKAARVLG